jgi:hypothetical protein
LSVVRQGRKVQVPTWPPLALPAELDDPAVPEATLVWLRSTADNNNAAIGRFTTMSDVTIEEYELVRRVGLDGTFYVTREVWPIRRSSGTHLPSDRGLSRPALPPLQPIEQLPVLRTAAGLVTRRYPARGDRVAPQ